MTIYLPLPYPDELLYSVFARYFALLGIEKTSPVTRQVFGLQIQTWTIMVNRLDLFQDRVGPMPAFDARSILERATLFPYLVSALGSEAREDYAGLILSGQTTASLQRLRALWRMPERKAALHYCEACVSEDLERLGETYWRRAHQLRVVLRCDRHRHPLVPSPIHTRPYGLRAYWDATTFARRQAPPPTETIDGDPAALELLARGAIERLRPACDLPAACLDATGEAAVGQPRRTGMPVGKVAVRHLARGMQDFYGPAIRQFLGADDLDGVARVIGRSAWSKAHLKSPTIDLLIQTYVDANPGAAIAASSPVTMMAPPSPETGGANAACRVGLRGSPGYDPQGSRTRCVVDGRLSLCGRRRRKGQEPTPDHLADMRLAWQAALDEAETPKIWNARRREELLYRTLMKYDRSWMDEQKAALLEKFGSASYRGHLSKLRQGDSPEKLAFQRDTWRKAIAKADHPKWSTAAEANPTLYGGLLENDREWMAELHREVKRQELRKRDASDERWSSLDEDLLRRLEASMGMLLQMGDRRRLSRTKISVMLSLPKDSETRVPMTMARIDRYVREQSGSDDGGGREPS